MREVSTPRQALQDDLHRLQIKGLDAREQEGVEREQQNLRTLTAESQQGLRQAAQALGAIDERVLVTRADGRLAYLNPQAEQLFGLTTEDAGEHHLLELLPGLGVSSHTG